MFDITAVSASDQALASYVYMNAWRGREVLTDVTAAIDAEPDALTERQCGTVSSLVGLVYLNEMLNVADEGSQAYLMALAHDHLNHAYSHGNALAIATDVGKVPPEVVYGAALDWVMSFIPETAWDPAEIFAV